MSIFFLTIFFFEVARKFLLGTAGRRRQFQSLLPLPSGLIQTLITYGIKRSSPSPVQCVPESILRLQLFLVV
jgi:hypothetical protein